MHRLLPLLCALGLMPAVSATAPPGPAPVRWTPLATVGGTSYLQVPAACGLIRCPLVVVSHPRGQTAGRMRDSPQVNVLTRALVDAHFAVLLSGDGGPAGWGSAGALSDSAAAHLAAVESFAWNGRTYALGLSMGGLLALRSALPGAPYRVHGVALIDAWVDLRSAWQSEPARRGEIQAAHGLSGARLAEVDPLNLVFLVPALPLFLVSSPDDRVVPAAANAGRLSRRARPDLSEIVVLSGDHMGGNRFTPALGSRLVGFLRRLEALADPR